MSETGKGVSFIFSIFRAETTGAGKTQTLRQECGVALVESSLISALLTILMMASVTFLSSQITTSFVVLSEQGYRYQLSSEEKTTALPKRPPVAIGRPGAGPGAAAVPQLPPTAPKYKEALKDVDLEPVSRDSGWGG